MRKQVEIEGVKAIITDQKPAVVFPYDECVLDCHKKNCGFYILDIQYESPIDNEFDLSVIYEYLDNHDITKE